MNSRVLDLLIPARCAACGVRGAPCCAACGEVWGALTEVTRLPTAGLVPVYALARYEGVAKRLLIAYKERGRRDLGPPLGRAVADALPSLLARALAPGPGSGTPQSGNPRAGIPRGGIPESGIPTSGVPELGPPTSALPEPANPRAGNPPRGFPEYGNPGPGLPNSGIPGPENPGTGNPGTGTRRTGNPGCGNPTAGNPTLGNPGAGLLRAGNSRTGKPSSEDPAHGDPRTGNPTSGHPGFGRSWAGNPTSGVCLVPAPSRRSASRLRGGPHVRRLAEAAAALLAARGVPAAVAPALRLAGGAKDAVGLNRAERLANLEGRLRFVPAGRPPPRLPVVVLDDVVTSGATAAACARVLRGHGVEVVAVLALLAAE
ncbi:hypothetical protein [Amycolatopsis sp. NPDC059021]|uniref:hypothetical protein n=1 Tax=Amycolatopsis sp. NPDC059021 TaxID=3346704 RepID=UPI00366E0228